MKITSVECYLGDKGLGGFVTVKVNTDEASAALARPGWPTANAPRPPLASVRILPEWCSVWTPSTRKRLWEHLHRHTFWGMGGGVVVTSAMAAIDTACWDIKARR